MPNDKPHSLGVFGENPFSITSCGLVNFFLTFSLAEEEVGWEVMDSVGSRMMAGNCMVPTSKRMRYRRKAELRGAMRDAASTVTVDQLGLSESGETRDVRGIQ